MISKAVSTIARLFLFLILTFSQFSTLAVVKLPKLISNGMVLQRDKPIKIWGWAKAGEKVSVQFNGNKFNTETNAEGKWGLTLPAMKAGGPHEMTIKGNNEIKLTDILIGEVWLCSGQSNMEFTMNRAKDIYPNEIANSGNNQIRQFLVKQHWNFHEQQDTGPSSWVSASPQGVLSFTAVGYFFALQLYNKYHVPVGLINSSVGGTPAEAWMSGSALDAFPHYKREAVLFQEQPAVEKIKNKDDSIRKAWFSQVKQLDRGYLDKEKPWYNSEFQFSSWPTLTIPGFWQSQVFKNSGGVIWLQKTISLSKAQAAKSGYIELGNIEEQDTTYINGLRIGATNSKYLPRKYALPNGVLREGENTITIRVLDTDPPGGFIEGKPYQLVLEGAVLPLTGAWKYKVGVEVQPLRNSTFTNFSYKPTVWYNSKIAPIMSYQIKGVLWYQGEGNVSKAKEYQTLFPALIRNWREKFKQGDFPFLFVQLANVGAAEPLPSDHALAWLREAQTGALALSNTGMAVTHDIGEWNDIHPMNKKEVGRRLFLSAAKVAYGEANASTTGPLYTSAIPEGNKIIIHFAHTGAGLVAKDGKALQHFAIAGADKKYVWAKAEIKGKNTVVVWANGLSAPMYVRYAWARNPEGANLYGSEGLPASSFRTDKFDH